MKVYDRICYEGRSDNGFVDSTIAYRGDEVSVDDMLERWNNNGNLVDSYVLRRSDGDVWIVDDFHHTVMAVFASTDRDVYDLHKEVVRWEEHREELLGI